nr:COP9 signalosome complex subunit 8-like [Marmota flaviventris]
MPGAVMAEGTFSFKKLLNQCKNQGLESPGGIAIPPVYGQLLDLYLLHKDTNNARCLWKRIPPAIKSANSELWGIWSVGQRIWERDFPGIYMTIYVHQWQKLVQPIMEALRHATRRYVPSLRIYEVVKVILEKRMASRLCQENGSPRKPVADSLDVSCNRFIFFPEPAPVPPILNEQQLARQTDYVALLEN